MSAIIFDFDGTIADNRDYIINFIANYAGKDPLTHRQVQDLYDMSMIAVAKRLGIRWWNMPGLLMSGRKVMGSPVSLIKPKKDIISVIQKLHSEGHELFIVSSNSLKNIRSFLRHYHIRQYFVEVYGGIEIFGKAPIFRELIREHKLDKRDVISIGDETRDIEASKSIGLKTIAVSWGFAKLDDLKNLKPNAVASSASDLISIIEEI